MQPGLADLQNLLRRLITAPVGVEGGLSAEKDLPCDGIDALIGGDGRLSATERLGIYANMYFYRLFDAITEDFPATFAVLGEIDFRNLITGYLIRYPPSYPSITEASLHLAKYVAESQMLKSKPFLADLVRLERALVETFLGPDQKPLTFDELRAISPQKWPSLRIDMHPAIRLLDCEWRVDEVLSAIERGQSVAPVREQTPILVWRKDGDVRYRAVDDFERTAFATIRRGVEFKMVCEAIGAEVGEIAAPALTSKMLSRWLAEGILVRVYD
jgi:putative DNA-binding protein